MNARTMSLAIVGFVFAAASSAATVTLTDANAYLDLSPGADHTLAGFNISGAAGGPATLHVRFGRWNGQDATLAIVLDFHGADLAAFTSAGAYYSNPESIDIDVSSLVSSGMNTLSAFATLVSGGPTTYSLGEISLTYNNQPGTSMPEPAPLAMFAAAAMAGLAMRRRKPERAA